MQRRSDGGSEVTGLNQPLRTALIALITAAAVAVVGGPDGFWLAVPAALVACSACMTIGGVAWCVATVVAAAAVALAVAHAGEMPSIWAVLLVPFAAAVVQWTGRRSVERDREDLRHAAMSDPLTGLANRRVLWERADYEIARHTRGDGTFVIVMIDLDGFKLINDRYGHAAGDQALCLVARALTKTLRAQDTVARLGGDEFCVVAPDTVQPVELGLRVQRAIQMATDGYDALSGSIGLAIFPDDGTTTEELLNVADERMLDAKRQRPRVRQRRAA